MRLKLLVLCTLALACGDSAPPPPTIDTGRRDGGTDARIDGGERVDGGDASTDVGDSGMDGDPGPDAADGGELDTGGGVDVGPMIDTGPMIDAGPDPDASACFNDAGVLDMCLCPEVAPPLCPPGGCEAGSACVEDLCGRMVCLPQGQACVNAADCASGSTCTMGSCSRPGGGCNDARDCALGFTCEAMACVDRRVPCSDECPTGYYCDYSTGAPFCRTAYRRCANDGACPMDTTCLDVLGDGNRICMFGGFCDANSDCPSGQQCANSPSGFARCGVAGAYRTTADCGSGRTCRDVQGDGILRCVQAGACSTTSMCAAPGLCGGFADAAPSCIVDAR